MRWTFDLAHSQIQFSVKHMGISTVRGTFGQFAGSIDEENGAVSNVTVDIDVASITTGNGQRDAHLKSADFFNIEEFPTAQFVLTSFNRDGDDVTATGNLTLRGVTKPVTLMGDLAGPVKDPWGNQKVSTTLEAKINRKDWGLTWNAALETGGVLVSEEVKLHIDVQAQPAVVAAAA